MGALKSCAGCHSCRRPDVGGSLENGGASGIEWRRPAIGPAFIRACLCCGLLASHGTVLGHSPTHHPPTHHQGPAQGCSCMWVAAAPRLLTTPARTLLQDSWHANASPHPTPPALSRPTHEPLLLAPCRWLLSSPIVQARLTFTSPHPTPPRPAPHRPSPRSLAACGWLWLTWRRRGASRTSGPCWRHRWVVGWVRGCVQFVPVMMHRGRMHRSSGVDSQNAQPLLLFPRQEASSTRRSSAPAHPPTILLLLPHPPTHPQTGECHLSLEWNPVVLEQPVVAEA